MLIIIFNIFTLEMEIIQEIAGKEERAGQSNSKHLLMIDSYKLLSVSPGILSFGLVLREGWRNLDKVLLLGLQNIMNNCSIMY